MVYKRYIKRGGKTYGPYYYRNYRDENGDIKREYLVTKNPLNRKIQSYQDIFFILIIGLVLILMIFFIFVVFNKINNNAIGRVVYASGSDDYGGGNNGGSDSGGSSGGSGSSGSSGGSSSGGSDSYLGGSDNYMNSSCTTGWHCSNWSDCIGNKQNRACINLDGCTLGKPSEIQSCISQCSVNWQCGNWSACVNYQQKRVCRDLNNCYENLRTQEESQICSKESIEKTGSSSGGGGGGVSWQCDDWEECSAYYGLTDLVEGNVAFKGEIKRKCKALNTDIVIEEKKICETRSKISLKEKEECNTNFLQILDEKQELVSNMNIDRVNNKLNLQFVLGNVTRCSYCYDRIKNYDETDVDCGGACPSCDKNLREYSGFWKIFLFFEWIIILMIVILIVWHILRADEIKKPIKIKKK